MREIKFRAWHTEKKRMFPPWSIWKSNLHGYDDSCCLNLMQYTGLKDKNGKEIYEGDIVRNGKGIIYEVRWYNFGFHLDTPKINGCWTSYTLETYEHLHWSGPSVSPGTEEPKHYKDWHIEIIGNIYENVHG